MNPSASARVLDESPLALDPPCSRTLQCTLRPMEPAVSMEAAKPVEEASRDWVRGRLLGSGSFGRVNAAVCASTGALFAVKSVYVSTDSPRRNVNLRVLENEIEVLQALTGCREIVRCLGSSWTHEPAPDAGQAPRICRNLHLELAPGGSVAGLLRDSGSLGLAEPLLRRYTGDVTRALHYMHSRGIVHGDVKGLNILIGDTCAKLADFGTAWRVDTSTASAPADGAVPSLGRLLHAASRVPDGCHSSPGVHGTQGSLRLDPISRYARGAVVAKGIEESALCCSTAKGEGAGTGGSGSGFRKQQRRELKGSPYWMSPETVREWTNQGPEVDIWSLGCTVLEMATGKAPWSEVTGGLCAVLYAIGCTDGVPLVPETLPPALRDFIACCLRRRPEERWTAQQLLQHPLLTGQGRVLPGGGGACVGPEGVPSHLVHSQNRPHAIESLQDMERALHRRTLSCNGRGAEAMSIVETVLMAQCSSGGCSSAPYSASLSPGGKSSNRKRGFSPLGCMVLEKAQCRSDAEGAGSRSPKGPGIAEPPSPSADSTATSRASPKRKRGGEDDTMTSSFPLLDLSLLKDKLPPGGSLQDGASSPAWPNSPLSQAGTGWIVVHSPKRH